MKTLLFCAALLACSSASADDLADADVLFAKKSYPDALRAYTKLANAGNPVAQRHLGEMYWYGEAGAVDDDKAQAWFRKSAASGDKEAAAALDIIRQRVVRKNDIEYWVNRYDGEELRSGKYKCAAPRLPPVSKEKAEIDAVFARIQAWQDCYNGFVVNLNKSSPLLSQAPADIAKLMKQEEIDKANARLDKVLVQIGDDARIGSQIVLADIAAWRAATESYIAEHNEIVKNAPRSERQADIDARKRNYAPPSK